MMGRGSDEAGSLHSGESGGAPLREASGAGGRERRMGEALAVEAPLRAGRESVGLEGEGMREEGAENTPTLDARSPGSRPFRMESA